MIRSERSAPSPLWLFLTVIVEDQIAFKLGKRLFKTSSNTGVLTFAFFALAMRLLYITFFMGGINITGHCRSNQAPDHQSNPNSDQTFTAGSGFKHIVDADGSLVLYKGQVLSAKGTTFPGNRQATPTHSQEFTTSPYPKVGSQSISVNFGPSPYTGPTVYPTHPGVIPSPPGGCQPTLSRTEKHQRVNSRDM